LSEWTVGTWLEREQGYGDRGRQLHRLQQEDAPRGTGRSKGNEYFECMKCGNEVDLKAFVYDNLDALSEDG